MTPPLDSRGFVAGRSKPVECRSATGPLITMRLSIF
jgi:hypothetical protein